PAIPQRPPHGSDPPGGTGAAGGGKHPPSAIPSDNTRRPQVTRHGRRCKTEAAKAPGTPDPVSKLADHGKTVAVIGHQPTPGDLDVHLREVGVERRHVALEIARQTFGSGL